MHDDITVLFASSCRLTDYDIQHEIPVYVFTFPAKCFKFFKFPRHDTCVYKVWVLTQTNALIHISDKINHFVT